MAADERDQTATLAPYRIEFFPASEEVMIDDADHVETVRHDLGLGKVFADQRTVDRSQIHAHHSHRVLSLEPFQVVLQGRFRTSQHDVVDFVAAEIAESRGIAFTAGEEML